MKIPKPSHGTVVAYVALFAALGGSAYAVSKVGTNDLKRSAVTSAKIKNRTIKGADVRNHSLGGKQIEESRLKVSKAVQSAAADASGCTVTAGTSAVCATTPDFNVPARGAQAIAVAYGSYSGAGSRAVCQLQGAGPVDRDAIVLHGASAGAGDGFSLAAVGPLNPDVRKLSLVCAADVGTATIDDPKIRAIVFAPPRSSR